jgi:hypothetical protein
VKSLWQPNRQFWAYDTPRKSFLAVLPFTVRERIWGRNPSPAASSTSEPLPSKFAATCGSFRDTRLAGAFFANRADVVDDMLNVEGGFGATTSVAARSELFQCCCVVLCDTRRRDVGTPYTLHNTLHIDAAGPTASAGRPPGQRSSSSSSR